MSDQGVSRLASDFIASRVRDMAPSPTLAVSDKARALKAQGIDVVDLGGGDPDFITPEHIRKAAIDAMNAGETHYVASPGIPPLRKAIAEKLKTDNELEYDWNKEILVTPGGKASLFQAMLALVEPGVEILVLEPAWVSYGPMIEIAGGTPVSVTLDADDNFASPARNWSKRSRRTRGILVNSPNNPTGRVLSVEEIDTLCAIAIEHDLIVYTDEMYEKIIYDGNEHISIATSWYVGANAYVQRSFQGVTP
ncbi:MAG: aminotransferase class I/II-fold pyridoxal phosphate-dependent enzyme [Thermomicrobiales bacterium]